MSNKKYRFRKVYFVCENKSVFGDYSTVNCFKDGDHAKEQEVFKQKKANEEANLEWQKGKPAPVFKTEGFYLVHESLYDELLKAHAKE